MLASGVLTILAAGRFDASSARWIAGPASANASTMVQVTMAELLARSTSVAVVTPVDAHALWEETPGGHGRRIVTYTRVKVDRMIDGAPLEETWVRTLGGRVGDIGQRVDGDALLIAERAVLLFLVKLPDGPHAVVGMGQGEYPLDASAVGVPPRLLSPLTTARVVPNPTLQGARITSASAMLAGKTVDEVAQLIAAARRTHAP